MLRRAVFGCLCAFAVALVFSTSPAAWADERMGPDDSIRRTQATAPRSDAVLSLQILRPSAAGQRLTLVRGTAELASIELPSNLSDADIQTGIANAVWNSTRSAAAAAFKRSDNTILIAFIQRSDGEYVTADVSEIERRIIGGIGPSRTYVRRETAPVAWEEWSEGRRVLRARARVWDSMGRRYGGSDAVVFSTDGLPLWR